MHNGLHVMAGGYYGDWMAHIIRALDGHHEPQEELVFHHLLRYVRHGSHIVELGAFWAYYTLWFLKDIPDSTATCIEPDPRYLEVGMHNARLNGLENRINFLNAWAGGTDQPAYSAPTQTSPEPIALPMIDMSALLRLLAGRPIELLHMDIQGFELPFIQSIKPHAAERSLRFLLVSTHHSSISGSKTTHVDCLEALRTMGAHVLIEHDVIESFSGDGLILASFYREDKVIRMPPISRNVAENSLFKTA